MSDEQKHFKVEFIFMGWPQFFNVCQVDVLQSSLILGEERLWPTRRSLPVVMYWPTPRQSDWCWGRARLNNESAKFSMHRICQMTKQYPLLSNIFLSVFAPTPSVGPTWWLNWIWYLYYHCPSTVALNLISHLPDYKRRCCRCQGLAAFVEVQICSREICTEGASPNLQFHRNVVWPCTVPHSTLKKGPAVHHSTDTVKF